VPMAVLVAKATKVALLDGVVFVGIDTGVMMVEKGAAGSGCLEMLVHLVV